MRSCSHSTISSRSSIGGRCGMAARICSRDNGNPEVGGQRSDLWGGFHEESIDVVGNDDAVVNGAEPAGHNDADATGVVQPPHLVGQAAADAKAFEFGAETRSGDVMRVVLEGFGRGGFDVVES